MSLSAEYRAFQAELRRHGRPVTLRRRAKLKAGSAAAETLEIRMALGEGAGVLPLRAVSPSPGVLAGSIPGGLGLSLAGNRYRVVEDASPVSPTELYLKIAPPLLGALPEGEVVTLDALVDLDTTPTGEPLRAIVGQASTSRSGQWKGTRRPVELDAASVPGISKGDEVLFEGESFGSVVDWDRTGVDVLVPVLGDFS